MGQQLTTTAKDTLLNTVVKMMGYASTNRGRKVIKEGCVKVNGKLVTFPATLIDPGTKVEVFDQPQRIKGAGPKHLSYTVYADTAQLLVFDKPSGTVSASPDPKRRTAFTLVRNWMFGRDPKLEEVFFVNKLPKEASGLMVIAKDAVTRARLQRDWNKLLKRYYVVAKGQFEEDGVIGKANKRNQNKEGEFIFPYRRMMQGKEYALLRIEMYREAFSELFSLLETNETPVPGFSRRGKSSDVLGRLGIHFFSVDIPPAGGKGKPVEVKTPVPREFLNLVKFNRR
jgi:23S rRNA-/tRNA-specific pseudouridylate synthase